MKVEKTFIAHSIDSFIDVVDSYAIDLNNKNVHCSFDFFENEYWFLSAVNKAFKRGVKEITFSSGEKYINKVQNTFC
ncbi:hypothetical protein [Aliivibrio fischeri]|uniref:hypothetical protein n=1 Tax=Aliivibrio fischeri TaxID=668 RepID=UPI0007C56C6E|nr:hypothetical protein [Aliivibrio fischeri]MUJ19692.1 hypothetical protein [Aliivibrio fischeri]